MKNRCIRTPIRIAVLLLTVPGCVTSVTRVPLQYELPPVHRQQTRIIAAYKNVADQRGDKTLDASLAPNTLFSVTSIVSGEIEGSGVFEKVLAVPSEPSPTNQELKDKNVTVLLEPFLFRLDSVVPDHESPRLELESFLVAFFGGAVARLSGPIRLSTSMGMPR